MQEGLLRRSGLTKQGLVRQAGGGHRHFWEISRWSGGSPCSHTWSAMFCTRALPVFAIAVCCDEIIEARSRAYSLTVALPYVSMCVRTLRPLLSGLEHSCPASDKKSTRIDIHTNKTANTVTRAGVVSRRDRPGGQHAKVLKGGAN